MSIPILNIHIYCEISVTVVTLVTLPNVHLSSEQVSRRQSRVDRLYVGLKELVDERKVHLEQQYWLFQLGRQVAELEHWMAEKEVVAGSPELGQDYEHVTLLQEKFLAFATETGSDGHQRVTAVNQMVDELIDYGHSDAATIAEWKDGLNEAWADLLELMDTRAQMLAASHDLHKFFNDCKDVLGQIEEKRRRLPELAAGDGRTSAGAMQRTLAAFERDVEALVTQVRRLQEGAAQLRTVYAGDNAEAIAGREREVVKAWPELLTACEECRVRVAGAAERVRFAAATKEWTEWVDTAVRQMDSAERPRWTALTSPVMVSEGQFRSAAAAWEERFGHLRRLTTLEKLKAEQCPQPPTPLLSRKFLSEPPLSTRPDARVAYVRHELRPERLQPRLDRVQPAPATADRPEETAEPRPERPSDHRSDHQRSDHRTDQRSDQRGDHRSDQRSDHRSDRRSDRRLERQESSEPEGQRPDGKAGGKATLADIVEQLQEKEAAGAGPGSPRESPGRIPAGPESLPDRTPRPERPRARDRPKPRRRPRPKDSGQSSAEPRRSRSAPAQAGSGPSPPAPATPPGHRVTHEGFLLRKHEMDGAAGKKASNRSWLNLYCVLAKGDLGFYKDAKGPAAGATHAREPLLSLHRASAEVASDYKKKKNVFKLRTGDGSEFLLQAKDEEEMQGWLKALATSAQEHAEV
ncbi:spectrin beta chain, non-erythrocytic 4-like, partial [Malurus melanocephalus]|uniref:spectrin beta chain, non-erythrocytic 4-like n=1 Tax=Malurus melanocephalus TaxID=175006 RepID=UPI00254939DF